MNERAHINDNQLGIICARARNSSARAHHYVTHSFTFALNVFN